MNKATFDRKYKAIKGHMLNPIRVVHMSPDGEVMSTDEIQDVYWDDKTGTLVILTK